MMLCNFQSPRWTPEDLARLDREYPAADLGQLAESMGRSEMSLMKRASMRGLRRITPEEREESELSRLFRDWAPAFAAPGPLAWRV